MTKTLQIHLRQARRFQVLEMSILSVSSINFYRYVYLLKCFIFFLKNATAQNRSTIDLASEDKEQIYFEYTKKKFRYAGGNGHATDVT